MYKIKLENFEGPLDLLLFFVRKDELNIYDIPIAYITKQYLDYLHLMQSLNLDIAGEFILMAATLMRIKAKMMLPPDPTLEDDEELIDPRQELSRRLIEYRRFKEASKSLGELDDYWRSVYRRTYFNFDLLPQTEEAVGLKDISFFDLLTAYKTALAKKPKIIYHNVERLNVTVEQQTEFILSFFRDRKAYLFTELCEDMSKIEIVVTFLALLDLIRRGDIAARQTVLFDDIWIYRSTDYADEIPEEQRALVENEMSSVPDAVETPVIGGWAEEMPETLPVESGSAEPEWNEAMVTSESTLAEALNENSTEFRTDDAEEVSLEAVFEKETVFENEVTPTFDPKVEMPDENSPVSTEETIESESKSDNSTKHEEVRTETASEPIVSDTGTIKPDDATGLLAGEDKSGTIPQPLNDPEQPVKQLEARVPDALERSVKPETPVIPQRTEPSKPILGRPSEEREKPSLITSLVRKIVSFVKKLFGSK